MAGQGPTSVGRGAAPVRARDPLVQIDGSATEGWSWSSVWSSPRCDLSSSTSRNSTWLASWGGRGVRGTTSRAGSSDVPFLARAGAAGEQREGLLRVGQPLTVAGSLRWLVSGVVCTLI